uniref:Transposable element Tc3 transposase n=1 Tax=Lygus hesperus TaxID=30085 RepID=A0A0A9YLJ5_LYGHE
MERWGVEHRVFVYDAFVKNNESVVAVQRAFRIRFNVPRRGAIPDRKTIIKWVNAFRTTGVITKQKPPGPARTTRTPENVERVRAAVLQSPARSSRQHAQALRISHSSVRRIIKRELHLHPYKLAIVQQLKPGDYQQRSAFALDMLSRFEVNNDLLLLMSDEAHFHLNGFVNKQNCRYYSHENPLNLHERPLHSPKVTAWCALSRKFIIGPYFFEEDGNTVTVNSTRYMDMLNNFLRPELRRRRRIIDQSEVWFQQDGAPPHTSTNSMALVREMFPGHLVSRFGDVLWPPRSPDLTTCDFFLWGYLKSRVYASKPRTLDALKDSIRREVASIEEALLERVHQNFLNRLASCYEQDGQHMTDVIFKK